MKILRNTFLPFLLTLPLLTAAQGKLTISGYVKDKANGEMLIGANVYIKELMKGTSSNTYGFYSLTVENGNYTMIVTSLGYKDQVIPVNPQTKRVNVVMEPKVIEAKEVEITGERADKNIQSTEMGTTRLSVEKIKTLPAFMGEVDVLKAIQLLPGVQNAGEGTTGFYVRGGGPDQNLILLDEAEVYNAAHLLGFFSVFNSDAIKNVTLIKSGMPANYGGKLASVLDINMNEGNNQRFAAKGGIGLISSRLTLEGPIQKNKSSFMVSGRRTYLDVLTKPFLKDGDFSGTGYYFYDVNAKLNYTFSDKDRLFFSGYLGRDVFTFSRPSGFSVNTPWGNSTATARWNHLFNDKLFMNLSAVFSDYNFATEIGQSNFGLKISSGIRDYSSKLDFSYFPNILHNVKFGAKYTYHVFTPSSLSGSIGSSSVASLGDAFTKHLYANEYAAYLNDEYDISEKLKVNAGLRYSAYQQIGPYDRYVTNAFDPSKRDTVSYKSGESIKFYHGLEPRLSLRYGIDQKSSLKAAYTHNYQYMHLTSFAAVTLPTDIWIPSSTLVKPQVGDQYALGYFRNFKDNTYETSVELYYKTMQNQVEYKESITPQDNVTNNIENNLAFGNGRSYGAEFFVKKSTGKFTGWAGYTYSITDRTFKDLNNGKSFFPRYDRRNDISLVATYEYNPKWTFSAVFVYATGNAITIDSLRIFLEGKIRPVYGSRNNFRMPDYHRLDLSLTYQVAKRKNYESSWNFSIYNVYNRMNPYFIYGETTGTPGQSDFSVKAYMVSLFPILPSATWNFKF